MSSSLRGRTGFRVQRTNDCQTASTRSAHADGLPVVLPLQTAIVNKVLVPSTNLWFTGKKLPYFWLNCCSMVKTDFVPWNANTRRNFYRSGRRSTEGLLTNVNHA